MNAEEREIQRTIWREQEAEEVEANFISALKRDDVKKFLRDFELSIHAPLPKRGFNEWNYWHCMRHDTLGLFPISAETLIEDAVGYCNEMAIPIYCRPIYG